jgi:hypothetical protein
MQQLIQVKLEQFNSAARVQLTTWVENDHRIKKGSLLSLREYPDVMWKVTEKYSITISVSSLDLNRNWDNNDYSKHKGLDYAKKTA